MKKTKSSKKIVLKITMSMTTPKSLRQSQGYIKQPVQPLPSILATTQVRGYTGIQEIDVVATTQMEETKLRIPRSAQAGPSRAVAFGSPSEKQDEAIWSCCELLLSERSAILRTPTKITSLPHNGKVHVMR